MTGFREAIHLAAQRKNGLLRFARNDGTSNCRGGRMPEGGVKRVNPPDYLLALRIAAFVV
jgi:hypothetical protein